MRGLVVVVVVVGWVAGCSRQPRRPLPVTSRDAGPVRQEELAPSLPAPVVTQEVTSNWCDFPGRQGRLLWEPVAGATGYLIQEVDSPKGRFNGDGIKKWSDEHWDTGHRWYMRGIDLPWHDIGQLYYRVAAVRTDGSWGEYTYGSWPCWIE